MIDIRNLSKTYASPSGPIHALKDINIRISKGEIFGVIGKSGAGKSTLIRTINLLEKPSNGQIFVNSQEILRLSPKKLRQTRHSIGMIFQHFNLLLRKTVTQNIALPLQLMGYPRRDIKDRIDYLLKVVELEDKRHAYPAQLSGGQKQRVAIARALASNPAVLLCDEATSALDPKTTQSILDLLKHINNEFNLTILLITHEMHVIKKICDKVAILEEGEIVEQGPTLEIFTHPKSQAAREFLHTAPEQQLPKELVKRLTAMPTMSTMPLIRLCFMGEASAEPIIAQLVKNYDLDINILQANIDYIGKNTIGTMLVKVINADQLPDALTFLRQHDVQVQELGYVTPDTDAIA